MKVTQTTPSASYRNLKIRPLASNPAREGTARHALLNVILSCKTAKEAFATPIKTAKGTFYADAYDLVWAARHGLIKVI